MVNSFFFQGVMILAKKLPNLVALYGVSTSNFGHVDFIFGKYGNHFVNEPILKLFNKYI